MIVLAYIVKGTVCMNHQLNENHYVLIEDSKITAAGPKENIPSSFNGEVFEFPETYTIVPGFIDLHIHGSRGKDAMDAEMEALAVIATSLPEEGTTAFLATTMTQSEDAIRAALKTAGTYTRSDENKFGRAEVLGIHLEGPFINPGRTGAQDDKYIIAPDIERFRQWQETAGGTIRLVTMAPEMENGLTFAEYLSGHGVVASIGHSDADYDEVKAAVEAGARHVTHLFNGMKGIHHREPGTAGAALLFDDLYTEIIADGIHIRPEMIDLTVRLKGTARTVLVTDSMRAKGMPDGESELGGQKVFIQDGKAVLSDGTLAGSTLKMSDAVKNVMKFARLTLPEAVAMATLNPAKVLGIADRKGSIEAGKDADLAVLNEELDPVMTICRGKIAYQRSESV